MSGESYFYNFAHAPWELGIALPANILESKSDPIKICLSVTLADCPCIMFRAAVRLSVSGARSLTRPQLGLTGIIVLSLNFVVWDVHAEITVGSRGWLATLACY